MRGLDIGGGGWGTGEGVPWGDHHTRKITTDIPSLGFLFKWKIHSSTRDRRFCFMPPQCQDFLNLDKKPPPYICRTVSEFLLNFRIKLPIRAGVRLRVAENSTLTAPFFSSLIFPQRLCPLVVFCISGCTFNSCGGLHHYLFAIFFFVGIGEVFVYKVPSPQCTCLPA